MIGQTLGHYRIIEKLGEGGMGEVYRAHDEKLDRDVALKVLLASALRDETARARLLREARTASALNHPHICTIYEVGKADGQVYIAMEFVEGKPLSEFVCAQGLPVETALRYGSQIAAGLGHAHERGVVHRDLKSANVVITSEGRAKVLDFGLAKRLEGRELSEVTTQSQALLTQPGAVMGTLPYMAPEQLRGEPADARSDVWALGVVLHEMLVGERPFRGQTGYELSSAILNQPPPALPAKVPIELRAVIEQCLAKEPARRYQRAGEVRAALDTIQSGVVAPWLAWPYRSAWGRKLAGRRFLALAGALAALVAVLVGLNVGGLRDLPFGGATRKITSIAVLPLENLTGDPDQAYFVEGMHQEILTELSKISALRVISRRSVQRYRDTEISLGEVVRELGVEYLLLGSVLREGDKARVSVELIDGRTEENLWADSVDRRLTNILSLHKEIARNVAGKIQVALTPDEAIRLTATRQINPKTYEAYLRGMFHLNKFTPEGFQRGLAYLHEAVEEDPADPLAYAGLAHGYNIIGHGAAPRPPENYFPRAEAAARRALELDDSLALAHLALAEVEIYYNFDWEAGKKSLLRALELDPNLAAAHYHYSWFHVLFGRWEEGIAEMKRAQELDPLMPGWTGWLGALYMYQGRHEEAIAEARKALEMLPRFPVGLYVLGESHKAQGNYEEAIAVHEQAAEISPAWRWPLGHTYAVAGRRDEALKIAAELEKEDRFALGLAEVYVALDRKDDAFRCLETSIEYRHNWVPWLEAFPNLKPLRDDPRFQSLLRRMNFPGYVSSR